MSQSPRRPAFRLRWGEGSDPAASEQEAPAEQPAAAPEDAAPAVRPAAESGFEPAPTDQKAESNEFLRELVDAMRRVAEESRDTSLAELRSALEARLEELKANAAERAEDLRRRSELDIGGIGDWERSEIERIRAEAEQRREARRAQLERQLAEHQSEADRAADAARARLGDHERALDSFFAELAGIQDPEEFVAAVKRMPGAPDLSATPGAKPEGPATSPFSRGSSSGNGSGVSPAGGTGQGAGDESALAQRLAQLNQRLGTTPAEAPEKTPPPAAAAEQEAQAPVPVERPAGGESSTPIVVKGLGSFGAITSFKQALERVDGIRGVTLSLGPTGEFVYRASHTSEFDIIAAIRQIEGPGAGIEESEGSVLVTIERQP